MSDKYFFSLFLITYKFKTKFNSINVKIIDFVSNEFDAYLFEPKILG